ncbi:NADPH:quinone oxidoreductase family protein [Rhodoligotrophos defluvii]|uniref:NADPH:quinone oxidoreductase family protein n=1 Tax=Rhodoligotrophos defluvii TaxID=2561934 RepID=UPI0010C93B1C|nr:NADPH:quinone oxidoreductase family protein [Rhodoligotrophos defluvii]
MRAVLCRNYGPPESLVLEELPSPAPGAGEVLIRVRAAGLNFFDTLIIENKYQFKPQLPFSPAGEVAGDITAIGEDVQGFRVGDRVMAYLGWNGAREEVVAPVSKLIPLPDAIDYATAAGLSVTYGTTLHALKDRARIQPGETLAVLGAAGGTGQAAIELGKQFGARVIAAASSDDKLAFCRELGADEVINYERESLKDRLKELTDGKGVDVVYDPVGGPLAEQALRSTGWYGRFLVIGFAGGEIPKIPLNLVLLKSCDIVGVFWGAYIEREPQRNRENMEMLLGWCASGRVRPRIDRTFPLDRTADALNVLAKRQAKGKIILEV